MSEVKVFVGKEKREEIENTINSAGYKMIRDEMILDLKATRNTLVIFAGREENQLNDVFKKGQIDKLVNILNLPKTMLEDLEKK